MMNAEQIFQVSLLLGGTACMYLVYILCVSFSYAGKSQLSESEVTATRRIASVRIHVERAINRVKTYRILQQPLPIKSKKLISKIIFVCAGLCNLKPALIKEQTGNGTVQD